jgi:hypothetical protein
LDLQAITDALGDDLVEDAHVFLERALRTMAPSDEGRHDALAELLISMIVTVTSRDGSEAEFVSRLDNLAERLRSAGMADRGR